ncbi:hypothetical protein BOQ63_042360 [Streptomyces viridifaciens]|uniref:hypothetical protein n=1 Tax=Kitasatospora aureofaciens TaxID=1894 RepID=UPI0007C59BC0|nr:hypothetical protein [Kitasatospora aureofaciens]UKZ10548.1 hypothetical protein BOQ63_042360 [Streptomyces viridifaciens]
MLLLGLLLMAASGAFIGLLIADNLAGGPEYQATVLGTEFVKLNSLAIFLSGVALALLFCLGLALMGLARRATRRPVAAAGYRGRAARRVEPVAPPETLDRPGDAAPVTRDERAADQGGQAGGITPEPQRRRGRHLFGH